MLLLYLAVCFMMAALLVAEELALNAGIEIEEAGLFTTASQFAVTNVITMGYGRFVPESNFAFILATVQQLSGIISMSSLDVFLAKLQPKSDLSFSAKALITTRDGVPTFLFRVANLRSNFIYSPEMRCSVLRRVVTKEGEDFMKFYPLKSQCPQ